MTLGRSLVFARAAQGHACPGGRRGRCCSSLPAGLSGQSVVCEDHGSAECKSSRAVAARASPPGRCAHIHIRAHTHTYTHTHTHTQVTSKLCKLRPYYFTSLIVGAKAATKRCGLRQIMSSLPTPAGGPYSCTTYSRGEHSRKISAQPGNFCWVKTTPIRLFVSNF